MFDVIIIGAGVTGLGAAWYLTETLKQKVLLLEQFPFPHQFGSSGYHSRIIRQLYKQDFNCNLMKEAVYMWRNLESKTGESLFIQNEMLSFGPYKEMNSYLEAIKSSGICAHEITSKEAKEKFPNFHIPEEYCIILDPIAGVLKADKCLLSLKNQSVQNGLKFHDMEKVLDITVISETEVEVVTNKAQYRSKSVIIATGIWSPQFLKKFEINFPLTPKKIYYALFKPEDEENISTFYYNNLPSFMCTIDGIYGMSGAEYPGCLKIGDGTEEEINPDKRYLNDSKSLSKDFFLQNVKSFLKRFIPKCSLNPVDVITCVITVTPDEQPILDYHANYKNVIIGCGFNGCGFKTGVIHGKILAELASNLDSSYNMKHFSISRFN